ncbi:MAG TPA: ferrous iron transport protein B [Polyangiaceae bacterium]|nr:ferrous iron transport protein B [Polyangiaceae bacterium]
MSVARVAGEATDVTDTESERRASQRPDGLPLLLLVGNPNVGKTSLFNRLARRNERVGNYPGVTVERRTAEMALPGGRRALVADVPGAYSLSARSSEEQIALQAVLGWGDNPRPDLVVVVVDAGQLVRNLYLVLQLIELRVPLLVALNMVDEAGDRAPDPEALGQRLGVTCVATNARAGGGLEELQRAIAARLERALPPKLHVSYPPELIRDADAVADALPRAWRGSVERDRALSLWALTSLDPDDELVGIPAELRQRCAEVLQRAGGRDTDREIIESRYRCLEQTLAGLVAAGPNGPAKQRVSVTERIDRALLHPAYGFAVFLAIMLVVFQSLFAWADPLMTGIEELFGAVHALAVQYLPSGFVRDLITEGVIDGVGNVVVFLPQICLLFLFIGLLEDSGYMARVAYLMDRALRAVGLHGRAFVPMMSGFACAVPAIMATRTMERRRDRLLTMLVVPLMSCSARLPVYTLLIGALFPPSHVFGLVPVQGLLMVAMYVFSTSIALIAAAVLGRTLVRGPSVPLILELPPYRWPGLPSVVKMVWLRARSFLREAGTVILGFTIVMWVLLSYPKPDAEPTHGTAPAVATPAGTVAPPGQAAPAVVTAPAATLSEAEQEAAALEQSFGGRLGKAIEPALAPLGFDWKIGVGIIGAFAAREVFVSVLGMVYGLGEIGDDQLAPLRERMRAETRANGHPTYTPLVGLSLMVFFALACQCMSTLAVVRRETQSWRWPLFMFGYMTTLAWVMSFLVYQGGRALGF